MKEKNYDILSKILILAIASIILIAVFDKYIFLLDAIPKKVYQISDLFYGRITPEYGGIIMYNLIMVILQDYFQKVMIFSILFMSGYSMYSLVSHMSSRFAIYSGILYMINPYIYVRMILGQFSIVLSYSMLPLCLMSFVNILEKKEKKEMIKFMFLLSIIAFNIHILILSLIIMSVIFLFWFDRHKDIKITKIIIFSSILFILLNFYWILPVTTAKNIKLDSVNEEDFKAFSPKIDNISDLFNIASMYGFWREGYIYAKDFIPYWQLLSIFIILLAIYGFISFCQDEKIGYIVKALGAIGIIGFILATGINGPFGDLNHWLYDNTILKGFRDSHKFVAMLVLSYAILGGLGINKIKSIYDGVERKVF